MRFVILSILLLCESIAFAQNRSFDSLSTLIQHHDVNDTVKVNLLVDLGTLYLWRDYYQALQQADQALQISRALNYNKGIAAASNVKSFCYWALGDNDLAIQIALESEKIAEKENKPILVAECYLNLSRAYLDLGEKAKSKDYVKRAGEILLKTESWIHISSFYNWMGVLATVDRNTAAALTSYKRALQVASQHSIPKINFPRIISNIGECYLKTNRDTAFVCFDNALRLSQETGNKTAESSISSIMGLAVFKEGDYKKAEEYFTRALQLGHELGLRRTLRSAYAGMMQLREQQGKPAEAMEYMKRYYAERDSLSNTSKSRQIVELESKYKLEKKEQEILILEQEKQIETIWRNILIVGVALIIGLSFFTYRLLLSRARRTAEHLELQQRLNENLRQADRLKTSFFNNVSHELRTPLTLILAPIEHVLEKEIEPDNREDLQLARRNANRMLELVNQLLDISRAESGNMPLLVMQGNLKLFLMEIAGSFELLAAQWKIDFVKRIMLDEGPHWFDHDKVEKIIMNILVNAFKFTPSDGHITLLVSSDNDSVSIAVTDSGPGIPESEQTHIFSPFYQMKQHRHHQHEGTGLGLSLVKELVNVCKGSITVQSKAGAGSTFTVVLPVGNDSFGDKQQVKDIDYHLEVSLGDKFSSAGKQNSARSLVITRLLEEKDLN